MDAIEKLLVILVLVAFGFFVFATLIPVFIYLDWLG